ncbi:MAG TPA: polysaccharide pyruvyl transferase family protein [Dongiaceae bacterium]|nr:polysaccharide pyruvyl transferase family protein [Dongiaceae bacterium]
MRDGDQPRQVVLLNDTSLHNHHGCRHVVATIRRCLAQRGLQVIDSAPAGSLWSANNRFLSSMRAAGLILINGEGTLHHGAELAARLLSVVDHPARVGKPVALINTIYQENPPDWVRWLGKMDLIATRDRTSQAEIASLGLGVEYAPDLSLYAGRNEPAANRGGDHVGYGDSVFPEVKRALRRAYQREQRPRLYLPIHTGIRHPGPPSELRLGRRWHNIRFKLRARIRNLRDRGQRLSDDVDGFVADLRRTSIYLTGRYHGICLAISAGVPFRAVTSNSHKIEALLKEAGLNPDRLVRDVSDIAVTSPEDWQFSAGETERLSVFLRDGRSRTDVVFDRLADLARKQA